LPGRTGAKVLSRGDIGVLLGGSSYSPGVIDAEYSLSSPKTVCAWWSAISYERWPCFCAEHSGSKGV